MAEEEEEDCGSGGGRGGGGQPLSRNGSIRELLRSIKHDLNRRGDFMHAYLATRRHNPYVSVKLIIVRDKSDKAVDFGYPSEWASGTAENVLSQKWTVEWCEYDGSDDEDIESAGATNDTNDSAMLISRLSVGVSCAKGPRTRMEDEHVIIKDFAAMCYKCAPGGAKTHRGVPMTLVAVFDGHGGKEASTFCRDHMAHNIARAMDSELLEDALLAGILQTESDFMLMAKEQKYFSGSTACVVLFYGTDVFVANVGDTRAVLCSKERVVELSCDHSPKRDDERKRVEREGGTIEYGYLNGYIGVTRAIGVMDAETQRKVVGLIATPDITRCPIDSDGEFIMVACDGLWNKMTSQIGVTLARKAVIKHGDAREASKEMVDEAIRRNTEDNVTCLLVDFGVLRSTRRKADGHISAQPHASMISAGICSNDDSQGDRAAENEISDVKKQVSTVAPASAGSSVPSGCGVCVPHHMHHAYVPPHRRRHSGFSGLMDALSESK